MLVQLIVYEEQHSYVYNNLTAEKCILLNICLVFMLQDNIDVVLTLLLLLTHSSNTDHNQQCLLLIYCPGSDSLIANTSYRNPL